jgi:hypothetical protein
MVCFFLTRFRGRTYCQEHGYEKCKGCRGPLTGTYIKYKESTYHKLSGHLFCVVLRVSIA